LKTGVFWPGSKPGLAAAERSLKVPQISIINLHIAETQHLTTPPSLKSFSKPLTISFLAALSDILMNTSRRGEMGSPVSTFF
jgi:hypothetical protein